MNYLQNHGLVGNHNCDVPSPSGRSFHYSENPCLYSNSECEVGCSTISRIASSPKLLVWTAASENAVNHLVQSYGPYYDAEVSGNSEKLDRLAYTLSDHRSHMAWRTFTISSSPSMNGISENGRLRTVKPIRVSASTQIAFVFTGQGAQYTNMGFNLLQYPVFEKTLKLADGILKDIGCDWSLFGK